MVGQPNRPGRRSAAKSAVPGPTASGRRCRRAACGRSQLCSTQATVTASSQVPTALTTAWVLRVRQASRSRHMPLSRSRCTVYGQEGASPTTTRTATRPTRPPALLDGPDQPHTGRGPPGRAASPAGPRGLAVDLPYGCLVDRPASADQGTPPRPAIHARVCWTTCGAARSSSGTKPQATMQRVGRSWLRHPSGDPPAPPRGLATGAGRCFFGQRTRRRPLSPYAGAGRAPGLRAGPPPGRSLPAASSPGSHPCGQ